MVLKEQHQGLHLYACEQCGTAYYTIDLAKRCEYWCEENMWHHLEFTQKIPCGG